MTRIERFCALEQHPMIGRDFRRLSKAELLEVETFIMTRTELTDDQFMHEANRWYLDQPKPKNYAIMWSLVIQSVDTVGNRRRARANGNP